MSKPMSTLAAAMAAGITLMGSSAAMAGCLSCGCGAAAVAYYALPAVPCYAPQPVFVVNQGPVYGTVVPVAVVPVAVYGGPAYAYARPYPYLGGYADWRPYSYYARRWHAYRHYNFGPRFYPQRRYVRHVHHRHWRGAVVPRAGKVYARYPRQGYRYGAARFNYGARLAPRHRQGMRAMPMGQRHH